VAGGVNCACADVPKITKMEAATVNVAESADLMTNPKENLEETLQGVERILERSLTSCQLSTSAWSATTAPRFRELRQGIDW
jgi:hypothetical protein